MNGNDKKAIAFLAIIVILFFGYMYLNNEKENDQENYVTVTTQNGTKKVSRDELKKKEFKPTIDAAEKEFEDKRYFPDVISVQYKVNTSDDTIEMYAIVRDNVGQKYALELADTMIRRFSSIAALNDHSLEAPGANDYGTLFDVYNIKIGVMHNKDIERPDRWLYYKVITAGMHTKQGPNWK